jgi:hypothetical protein
MRHVDKTRAWKFFGRGVENGGSSWRYPKTKIVAVEKTLKLQPDRVEGIFVAWDAISPGHQVLR